MEAHQITFTIPPTPVAVTTARRLLRDVVQDWAAVASDADVVHASEIVFSELVTNAIRYAGHCPVTVTARLSDAVLRMEIHDAGPTLPAPSLPDLGSEGGRGLFLIDALADRFGTTPLAHGKCCWAEFDVPTLSTARSTASTPLPVQRSCT
ncbi:ATP-binding protein [Streptomyces sp. NPDC046203]|uniref:ATP-binding protein n=1 Tax=Streptomyces sp. NPDC046203 TaxID=3154602 RepID=UPI0033C544E7